MAGERLQCSTASTTGGGWRGRLVAVMMLVSLVLTGGARSHATPGAPVAAGGAAAELFVHQPEHYFNLVYCGSGRATGDGSGLEQFDWSEAARHFGLTIIRRHAADYRRFATSVRRQSPDHTLALYLHGHGLHQYDDQAGALNLMEVNYVHAAEPAALQLTTVDGGLLVDWATDERWAYDEYGVISAARAFVNSGYVVLRGESAAELLPLVRVAPQMTAWVDSSAVAGTTYRYRIDTINYQGHQLPFSYQVEGVRSPSPRTSLLLRDYQRAITARIDSSTYPMRVRIHAEGPLSAARLCIDRNLDRDFDDPGEIVPMEPNESGWLEAITELDPAARSPQDLRRILGFPYRLEFDSPDGTLTLPRRGVFTTSVNNRVRSPRYGFYLMHPDTDGWLDHQRRRLRHRAGRSQTMNAVFMDELVVDLRYAADAEPIDTTTEGFRRASVQLLDGLKSAYPHLQFYYNGAGEGIDPPQSAGGMIEGFCLGKWFRGGSEPGFAPPAIWATQMESALRLAGSGREVLLLARDLPSTHARARLFALASFHLVRGAGSRFCYLPTACGNRSLPEWQVNLGAAEEAFRQLADAVPGDQPAADLYRRRFEFGEVWVNAGRGESRTVSLENSGFLVELTGEENERAICSTRVTTLELAPQSGAIVIWPTHPGGIGAEEE